MVKLTPCPACTRNISHDAQQCPKCGDPLDDGWVEKGVARYKSFARKCFFWLGAVPILIVFLPYACSKLDAANAQEQLPRTCWAADEAIPSNCQGEVNSGLFPFCPSEDLYEQVKDMMPKDAARLGCEADVEGRMVKVLSCSYTSCKYSLYYGYDSWKTMWSQKGVVTK